MSRSSVQGVLTLALVAAQLFIALIGPGRAIVCRDDDGTAHVEVFGEHCPAGGCGVAPGTAGGDAAADWCPGNGCSDEPLAGDLIPARLRSGEPAWTAYSPARFTPLTAWWSADRGRTERVALRGAGTWPPGQSQRCLRSVVLIL